MMNLLKEKLSGALLVFVIFVNLSMSSCGSVNRAKSIESNSRNLNASRVTPAVFPACSALCVEISKKPSFSNVLCGMVAPLACSAALNAIMPAGPAIKIARFTIGAGGVASALSMGACFDVFSYGNCSKALNCTRYLYRQDAGLSKGKYFDSTINCYRSFCADIRSTSEASLAGYRTWCSQNQM